MKARLVTDIRAPGAQPGDIEYRAMPDGEPGGYAYRCPGCGQEDWMHIGSSGWTFTGSIQEPTLRPSILHRPCGWHGYLTAGEFVVV